jgi:hypothetical protein
VNKTQGNVEYVNGKPQQVVDPLSDPAHTFTVPSMGVSVPLFGVPATAKNTCAVAPCTTNFAHETDRFTFHTGAAGVYRWQCFVPCGLGFLYGNGGPMSTLGYMGGFLDVVKA